MSRSNYRCRSDYDSRTLPTISTRRTCSYTPIHPPQSHPPRQLPRLTSPNTSNSVIGEYSVESSRSIPYVDAESLAKLLSPDKRPVPRRPYVFSDLSTDRLARAIAPDSALNLGPCLPPPTSRRATTTYPPNSSWHQTQRALRRVDFLPQHPHPHSSAKPSGISWHRTRPEASTNPSRANLSSTPTTATSSGSVTPIMQARTTPVSPERLATRRKGRRLAHHRSRRATSVIGNERTDQAPFLSVVGEKPAFGSTQRRHCSSHLTTAFSVRKLSALSWIPDQLRYIPADVVFDHQPIHPVVPLVPFGHHWSFDVVLLYTNSLRAELNDFIFLIGCLQHSLADPLKKKKRHKNLETDFRVWYQWFAQFQVQILRGFEDFFFPLVTQLLEQRNVMISRATAVIEAKGMSYPEAWFATTSALFQKMEYVRDSLATIHNRLFRLQQKPGDAEDAARATLWCATFDTVAKLIPATVDLLAQLDHSMAAILALKVDCKKGLRKMYRQFAVLMIREGSPPLGWSAVTVLTRCINDRKLRSQHALALARAARQSVFSRYRADHSHDNIVKAHRIQVFDEQRRGG